MDYCSIFQLLAALLESRPLRRFRRSTHIPVLLSHDWLNSTGHPAASSHPRPRLWIVTGCDGESLFVEELAPPVKAALPRALLHHWRGTAFAPGAKAADFERLMKNFGAYPQYFSPQVMQAKVLSQDGDRAQVTMRVRQKHVLTVVMDTTYDINFGRLDAQHGYSISRSTKVSEIASPGTSDERVLSGKEEHGFLWRLNTYWSYEERDGGLYMQIESVSLTRSIPNGLGWAVQPFVESVPRESLEFTLRSTSNALLKRN